MRLEPIIQGPESADTIVFIQGWPDDASVWEEHVARLSHRYRCVRMTMPNFDGRRTVRWGYSTNEIVDALAALVREVSPKAPVTLVLHDWGSFWGHILHHRHPELANRVAGLDVAPHVEPGPAAILGIIAYQWWLVAAFLVGGPIGDWMTRSLAVAMKAPAPAARITAWMNYPYRNVWRDMFAGRGRNETADYWPRVPLLFVYGRKKPFPFHSRQWLAHVEDNGTALGLDCDHWVQRDPAFGDILDRWLDETQPAADTSRSAASV